MTCLITGAAGFAGSHLARLLAGQGRPVVGLAMPGESLRRVEGLADRVEMRVADITDAASVGAALGGERFEHVFHLAAVASVPAAIADPAAAFRVNTLGTVNLLGALQGAPPERFLYISSADVYGHVAPEAIPIRETETLKPASPYAASKAAAEIACMQCWRANAFPSVVLRPFNHTGPGQGAGFAPSDFAMAIARIERGLQEPRLAVGNLDSYRDYSDVRDMVRAYAAAAGRCEAGETYNICCGKPVRIADVLSALLGLSNAAIEVATDPSRSRLSDTRVVAGDCSKFERVTGWQPAITLEDTLKDLLDSWRAYYR